MFSTLDPKHVRNKLIFFSDGFLVSTVYENEQTEGSPVYPDPGGGGGGGLLELLGGDVPLGPGNP